MANIPPKAFYKLSQEEQEKEAVRRMNGYYEMGDAWKKIAVQARKKLIVEPDERPDLLNLKDPVN